MNITGKKKIFNTVLAVAMVITLTMITSVTSFAATGSKKVTSSGKMSVVLNAGATGNSSAVTFTVSGLPANAVITKLEVYTGSLSYSGAVLTNYLIITSSNGRSEQITWLGAANTTLTTSRFLMSLANGTYTISFNATNGSSLNIGTKTYSSPYIVVYWDDSF